MFNFDWFQFVSVRFSPGFFGQPVTLGAECCSQEPSFFLTGMKKLEDTSLKLGYCFLYYLYLTGAKL